MNRFRGDQFDYVITVCNQAQESCPVFPGVHRSLHWDFEDPAAAEGTEEERLAVFRRVLRLIEERIDAFVALALVADLDAADLDVAEGEAVPSRR